MKINKLKLHNFRIHKNTEIDLAQFNVIVGKNGSGKTSIKDAVEYCLTGKNRLTDGRGSGAEVMVNWDADKALIELLLSGIGNVKREIPNQLQVSDWSGKKTIQEKTLLDRLNTNKRSVKAILNTTDFLNLDADKQQEIIFDLSGVVLDKDEIISEFLKWNEGEIDKSRDILMDNIPDNIKGGGKVLDRIYKDVYALRREEKKNIKSIKNKLSNISQPDSKLKNISPEDKEEVKKQYDELTEERDKLFKYLGKLEADIDRSKVLKEKITALKNNIKKLEKNFDKESLDSNKIDDLHEKKDSLLRKNKNQEDKFAELNNDYNKLVMVNKEKKEAISFLHDANSNCPLAPDYIDCPLKDEEIDKLINKLEDELAIERENNIKENLRIIKENKSEISNKLEDIESKIQEKSQEINEQKKIKLTLDEHKIELNKKENELKEINSAGSVSDLKNEINKLDKRLNRGKKIIQDLKEIAKSKKMKEKHKRDLHKAKERLKALKLLVKAFKPSGIKSMLLENVTGKLQKDANIILSQLTSNKFQISFNADCEDFLLIKKVDWPEFATADILSTSEKLRIGVILQHILNQLTGLDFLMIDKADTLDPENRQLLINTALSFRDAYDQIIILSTVGEIEPQNPDINGLKMWYLEEGNLKEL